MLTSTVATLHNNAVHGEDRYVLRPLGNHTFLDAVMDGVSGRQGGEASRWVAEALTTAPLASADDVLAVLQEVNRSCYRRGMGRFFLTTASVVFFQNGTLSVISAGDSPVYLIRADTLQQLSSPVSGLLPAARARAIGTAQDLGQLHRTEVTIVPGDRLMLATDGITDTMSRHELLPIVRDAQTPDDAAQRLHALVTTRQTEQYVGARSRNDDWTAILRFFDAVPRGSS